MAEAKVLPSFHETRMFDAVLATARDWTILGRLEPVATLKETFLSNLLSYYDPIYAHQFLLFKS
jgi:hypothetical protein